MKTTISNMQVVDAFETTRGEYRSLNVVLQDEPGYQDREQFLCLEIGGKNFDRAHAEIKAGDTINAEVDITSRSWTDKDGVVKYFTSIKCWRWQVHTAAAVKAGPQQNAFTEPPADDSDVPF